MVKALVLTRSKKAGIVDTNTPQDLAVQYMEDGVPALVIPIDAIALGSIPGTESRLYICHRCQYVAHLRRPTFELLEKKGKVEELLNAQVKCCQAPSFFVLLWADYPLEIVQRWNLGKG
jgi:hypothetical protein